MFKDSAADLRQDAELTVYSMIAVMTMNVGYFMSVLAGIWVGSFVFGRFMASSASH